MHWIVMDSTIELILLFYTFTSLNNNRILLLIVKKGSEFYHSQFHILENRDTNFTEILISFRDRNPLEQIWVWSLS